MFTTVMSAYKGVTLDVFKLGSSTGPISLSSDITGVSGQRLDAHFWLPMAASALKISPDLKDYLICTVIGVVSDVPNTNGDCISRDELLRWNGAQGCPMYRTFKGRPTYLEHDNQDLLKAKGVIFDAFISPLRGHRGNHAKVVMLAGFDRTKDPSLVADISSRRVNTYSIGATYDSYVCSSSGIRYAQGQPPGRYTRPGVPTYMDERNRLVYRSLENLCAIELSSVSYPAYTSAVSDDIL